MTRTGLRHLIACCKTAPSGCYTSHLSLETCISATVRLFCLSVDVALFFRSVKVHSLKSAAHSFFLYKSGFFNTIGPEQHQAALETAKLFFLHYNSFLPWLRLLLVKDD